MTKSRTMWYLGVAALASALGGCGAGDRGTGDRPATNVSGELAALTGLERQETPAERVTLSATKREAAGIRVQSTELREIPDIYTVPGRIEYDDRRHVEVRVATPGIIVDVRVKPGDRVQAGQPLAVISSPELGEVRAEVLRRQSEWEIAQRKHEWEAEIEKNLTPFVAALRQRQDFKGLDQQFRTRTLGEYREKLVAAYARLLLAESLHSNASAVASAGILAERTLQERASEWQAADAALVAACEQSTFDARQRRDLAALAAADAQRRLEISRQQLRTLLGYHPAPPPPGEPEDLSLVEIRAPFSGTIERRNYSTSERVQPNDAVFILADTSHLWVAVDIREKDWQATQIQPGTTVTVRVPAMPDREWIARVHYVGREVAANSNALSVVAEIDNEDGLLRPGLFVQASLSIGSGPPVLAVPAPAIVTQGEESFVFVQESIDTYRRCKVRLGRRTDDWAEVRSGLATGDSVVVHGAFVLKSELLLDPEE